MMSGQTAELSPHDTRSPASILVSNLLRAWPKERAFSARDILAEHPELSTNSDVVIDLACEEYERRTRSGERVSVPDFIRDYPTIAARLHKLIFVLDNPPPPEPQIKPQWPVLGETIGQFRLLQSLGWGEQSRVFLAEDLSLDRRSVVLKFVPLGSSEAVLLARTEHPHVMPVQHVISVAERRLTAISMPYLGRATLCHVTGELSQRPVKERTTARLVDACIAAGWLDPAQPSVQRLRRSRAHAVDFVLQLGLSLAEACAAAHQRGVLHRDIKPSNVLLSFRGEPLLLDFNLARASGAWGCEGGTLPYMPPERLAAWLTDPALALPDSTTADVFSLGATLFEVLAGEPPFGYPSRCATIIELVQAMHARQQAGPVNLQKVNPCVNRSLARLLASTLALDPQQRPQSMHDFAAALRSELSWRPRFVRRLHWRPVQTLAGTAAAAAAVAALIPLGGWAWDHWRPSAAAAVGLYQSVSPDDVAGLTSAGVAALEAGHPAEALGNFQQALKLQPSGRLYALAATAALRDRTYPATTQRFLEAADKLGYASIEHQNNWAVYELQFGKPAAACERLKPLIEEASKELLPTVLLNWMEAELKRSLTDGNPPEVTTLQFAERRCEWNPWHHLRAAKLTARALSTGETRIDGQQRFEEILAHAQAAAASGIARDQIESIAIAYSRLLNDSRWRAIVKKAPLRSSHSQPEATLLPREQ